MTITITIKRPSFVVLATDRLYHGYAQLGTESSMQPVPLGQHDKIALHASLPISCATAGFASFDGRETTSYIQEVIDEFTHPSEISMSFHVQRFKEQLRPLVLKNLQDPMLLPDPNRNKLDVFIALVSDGQAQLARLRLADSVEFKKDNNFFGAPRELAQFYTTGQYANDSWVYGDRLNNPSEIAQHLRRVISQGIQFEASLWPDGQNRLVGGGIDVAIVDNDGARWLSRYDGP